MSRNLRLLPLKLRFLWLTFGGGMSILTLGALCDGAFLEFLGAFIIIVSMATAIWVTCRGSRAPRGLK